MGSHVDRSVHSDDGFVAIATGDPRKKGGERRCPPCSIRSNQGTQNANGHYLRPVSLEGPVTVVYAWQRADDRTLRFTSVMLLRGRRLLETDPELLLHPPINAVLIDARH